VDGVKLSTVNVEVQSSPEPCAGELFVYTFPVVKSVNSYFEYEWSTTNVLNIESTPQLLLFPPALAFVVNKNEVLEFALINLKQLLDSLL